MGDISDLVEIVTDDEASEWDLTPFNGVEDNLAVVLSALVDSKVEILNVGYWDMSGDRLAQLTTGLTGHPTLSDLRLNVCRIDDSGAGLVAELMRSNRSLARVSLLGNKIGNAGGEELKSALIDSPNVESLELAGNAMDRLTLTTIESLVADRSNGIDLKGRIAEQQRAEIAAAKAEAEARAKAAREAAAQEAADAEAARQARLHTPHVRPPPPHIEVPGAGSSASGGTTGGVDASPVEVVPLVGGGSGSTSATPEPSTDGSPVTTEPSEPAAKPPQASSSKLPLILGAVVVVGAVVGGLLWWKKK